MLRRGVVALFLTGILSLPSSGALASLDYEESTYIGKIEAWSQIVRDAGLPIAEALDNESDRQGAWEEDLIPLMGVFGVVASNVEDTEPPESMLEVHDAFLDGTSLLDAAAADGMHALQEQDEQGFLAVAPDFIAGAELVGAARDGIREFQEACLYDPDPCDIDAEVNRSDGGRDQDVAQGDSESRLITGEIRFIGGEGDAWVPFGEGRNGCAAAGAYEGLKSGGTIRITNDTGEVLAEPEISVGILSRDACLLTFETEIPDSDVYVVELIPQDTVVYTRSTMEENNWNVSITHMSR